MGTTIRLPYPVLALLLASCFSPTDPTSLTDASSETTASSGALDDAAESATNEGSGESGANVATDGSDTSGDANGSTGSAAPESSTSGDAPSDSTGPDALDDSTDDGAEVESTTSDMETGEPGFAACFADESACSRGEVCVSSDSPGAPGHGTVCALPCATAADCPAPPSTGDAMPTCQDILGTGTAHCVLPCGAGETCPDGMECAAATVCLWPADWTCSLGYYAAGDGCDCGCGIPDPDCADASVTACEYCDDPGSCSASACPGTIDPDDNTACA